MYNYIDTNYLGYSRHLNGSTNYALDPIQCLCSKT